MRQVNYFELERNKLIQEESLLTEFVIRREGNICQLCSKQPQAEHLTIHTVREERPSLANTVCVCKSCKVRVIDADEDNANRLKFLFRPYLTRLSVKKFNEENPIVI